MNKIRFAILGCGRIAWRHAKQIVQKGMLTAVCDIDIEKADAFAREFGVRAFYRPEDLYAYKDIDVISVCTPNGLHAMHSIGALRSGFHVLCEKPMAIRVSDGHEMIRAAEEAGRYLFVVKQNRFNPPVVALKNMLDEGRLGAIYSLHINCIWNRGADYYKNSWKGTACLDGGTLFTQFSHFIDIMYWLAGDVKRATAYLINSAHQGVIEFEDGGVVIFDFANGAIGSMHYTVNSHCRNMEGSLTLVGEKGTVKVGGQYLNELVYQHIADYKVENLPAGGPANTYGTYEGSMSNHDKVYDNVIAVLQGEEAVITRASEALKTVEIIEKIYSSGVRL